MKVARKHIIAAIESGKQMEFPKYTIQPSKFTEPSGVFGWRIRVIAK